MRDKKYIVVSQKFYNVSAATCPFIGQIATDYKWLAYFIYKFFNNYSYKHYNTISVMLMKQNEKGLYDVIKR